MRTAPLVPVDRGARSPATRLPVTRPRGNGTPDPVLIRESIARLERVLGH
jgi:hypothetical protein